MFDGTFDSHDTTSNALTMQCVAPNTVQPGLALPNRKQHEDKIR